MSERASFSWYEYSPLRVKYPYIRGKLLDLWTEALEENNGHRIAAWASIVEDEEKAKIYKEARGRWTCKSELERCHRYYCCKFFTQLKDGPDRIAGFTLYQQCR